MFFNPLFLQVINNPESVNSSKAQKLNGSSYLFSDIIKVAFEKTELDGAAISSENGNSVLNMNAVSQFDANAFLHDITGGNSGSEAALYQLLGEVVPGNFKLGDLQGNKEIIGLPLVNNSDSKSIVLNENEISSMISKFLEGNFQGKVSVLSGKADQKKVNVKSFDVSDSSSLSSDELFSLLKDGNAVSLESSDAQNTKGLLITLFKIVSSENSDSVNDSGINGEVSDSEKKDAAEVTDPAAGYAADVPGKYYRVEITVIDKTAYQELSSLEFMKAQAPGGAAPEETANFDNSVYEINNIIPRIYKIQNGLTGPADMSGMIPLDEKADFNTLVNTASDSSAEGNVKQMDAKADSVNVNKTEPQPAGVKDIALQQPAITDSDEQITAVKNTAAVEKTDEKTSVKTNEAVKTVETKMAGKAASETSASGINAALASEQNKAVTGKTEAAANRMNGPEGTVKAQEPTLKSTPGKKETGETGDTELTEERAVVNNTAGTKLPADPLLTGQDDQNAALKNVKSGVLKNLNLTLKTSRTRSGVAAESESTENTVQPQQKESVRNSNRTAEQNIEEAPENPEKDLKEFSANISGKAFAKQMHDVANSVKENEIKTVKAGTEKQESSPVQNQDKATVQQESNTSGNETSHDLNEQAASHHKSDGNVKGPDSHFTTEMNKAAGAAVSEKPAFETGQNSLPSRLVKSTDVMKEISRFIEKNEGHSLTIKIDPESLGSVKIALDVVDKLVHANIEVENEAAKKMVESNLNQLYSSLSQSGIQLNSLNISLANQEGKQNKNFSGRKKSSNNNLEADFEQTNAADAKQMGYNTYEYTI